VSDEVMLDLIEERLTERDAKHGFILDGYPRNLAQAEALDELLERIGQPVDEALQIDVDIEMVIERIVKRAVEEGRSDDSEEVVRNRMKVYAERTAPVVEYYARKGLLSRVLGEGTIEEVFQRIRGVLQIRSA
jgi:adenylate kinase